MTHSLFTARERAAADEQRIVDQTRQLRAVLGMVREIGGSLNSGYVLAAITDGALAISGADRAVVWLQEGVNGESLARVWESESGNRVNADTDAGVSDAHVLTAAKFGRTTAGRANEGTADRLAVPLIVGAQVIGVLELVLNSVEPMTEEMVEVVETLSIHAATAIEASRLHEGTTHASEHDALTGLANRRRLETDLAAECNRSLRYGNDLSFIMLDLDHFKRLNDTYGHQRGDEALQGCARAILETLRTTDTAYRYGGEELAVMARETNLEGAMQLAERIRTSIAQRYPGTGNAIRLTASFGVAALPDHAATPEGSDRLCRRRVVRRQGSRPQSGRPGSHHRPGQPAQRRAGVPPKRHAPPTELGDQLAGIAVSQAEFGLPTPVTSSQPWSTFRLESWLNVRTE